MGVATPESKKIRLDLPPNLYVVWWVVKIIIKIKKRFGSGAPESKKKNKIGLATQSFCWWCLGSKNCN